MGIIKLIVILALAFVLWQIIKRIPLRTTSGDFKYVRVRDDGTVRDLFPDEEEYLMEEFEPADGARPYIKSYYWKKTPDKKIGGYLKRIRVPWWIDIEPISEQENSKTLKK